MNPYQTMNRMHKATKKPCYFLKDNVVPQTVQDGIKQTNTATGYFPFLLDLIVTTHKGCRTRHRYAWRKRFNKLSKFLVKKTINAADTTINQSDLNVLPLLGGHKEIETERTETEKVSQRNSDSSAALISVH